MILFQCPRTLKSSNIPRDGESVYIAVSAIVEGAAAGKVLLTYGLYHNPLYNWSTLMWYNPASELWIAYVTIPRDVANTTVFVHIEAYDKTGSTVISSSSVILLRPVQ